MKTKTAFLFLVLLLAGCTAMTTTDRSGFTSQSGKYYDVATVTVRDRTGTELHHVMVLDDKDKVVDHATGSGRGIVAGATDGMGASALQAAGLIGMGAVWPGENNNSTATANQDQGQGQIQGQQQGQIQRTNIRNNNCLNSGIVGSDTPRH